MDDRRYEPRLPVNEAAELSWTDESGDPQSCFSTMRDLSRSGARFEVAHPVLLTRVRIRTRGQEVTARVQSCVRTHSGYSIGVEFDPESEGVLKRARKTGLRVRAVNTASDSENRIHDNAVAAAYGFRGGLVPGVTVYGYLAAAVIQYFGKEWLEHGAMDVRFHEPVYEGDDVEVTVQPENSGRVRVEAGKSAGGVAWIGAHVPSYDDFGIYPIVQKKASFETLAPGTFLGTLVERLDLKASRMSAPLDPLIDGLAHPAALLALANRIFVLNYELGPWIHAASEVRNFRAAHDGEEVEVRARVVDRLERKGHQFVVLDVLISGETPIAQVRHTAIWQPRFVA